MLVSDQPGDETHPGNCGRAPPHVIEELKIRSLDRLSNCAIGTQWRLTASSYFGLSTARGRDARSNAGRGLSN